MSRSRWVVAASLVLTVAALTACSSSSSSSSTSSTQTSAAVGSSSSAAASGTSITISNFAFQPNALTLPPGKVTLSVTNDDSTLHSFTLDDGSVSKDIPPGTTQQVTITVPASGTLGWHCRIHSSMTGTITSSG
ncbi:MAG: cupredoxin domain-containing protein [Planctomycetaceae bacterium]